MTPELYRKASSLLVELELVAQEIIAETHQAIVEGDLVALCRHYAAVDAFVADFKATRKPIEDARELLSYDQIPEAFFKAGVQPPLKVDGVGTVTVARRWAASMADKDQGFAWLRSNGASGLIIETVSAQTLAAFAKERAFEGKDLPEEIFTVSQNPYTRISGRK